MRQGEAPAGLLDRIGGDASNKQLLIWARSDRRVDGMRETAAPIATP
jgi:hypothetical protein